MTEKPLSYTKKGKLISAVGGLFGGPFGVVASPLVLMAINYFTRKRNSKFNRFTIWAIIGVVLAPVCWIPVVAALLLATVVHIEHVERTDPAAAKKIQKDIDEFFLIDNPEKDLQRLRERYPDKSERWINCRYDEGRTGGSAENCVGE